MRYASVCDGIGAAHCAWKPLGWDCAWTAEIEPFPSAVVHHHFGYKNYGDFTKITAEQSGAIELLVGGTPCQDFSVAGLRKGMAGKRGNLTLEFVALAGRLRPKWLVWENVPGILSIENGAAFYEFLQRLAECGYGFAYRILNAKYAGVPQQRRRVFVVGCLGDWRSAAAVLFERESLRGNSPPCVEAREEIAGTIGARTCRSVGVQDAIAGGLQVSRSVCERSRIAAIENTKKHSLSRERERERESTDTRRVIRQEARTRQSTHQQRSTPLHHVAKAVTTGSRYDSETENFVVSKKKTYYFSHEVTPKFSNELCQALESGGGATRICLPRIGCSQNHAA